MPFPTTGSQNGSSHSYLLRPGLHVGIEGDTLDRHSNSTIRRGEFWSTPVHNARIGSTIFSINNGDSTAGPIVEDKVAIASQRTKIFFACIRPKKNHMCEPFVLIVCGNWFIEAHGMIPTMPTLYVPRPLSHSTTESYPHLFPTTPNICLAPSCLPSIQGILPPPKTLRIDGWMASHPRG